MLPVRTSQDDDLVFISEKEKSICCIILTEVSMSKTCKHQSVMIQSCSDDLL